MTLFELLTVITSVSFFAIAIVAAKGAKAGFGGYALAIIIGSSLAIGNAWGMYKIMDILADRTSSHSEKQEGWLDYAFWLLVLLWAVVGAFLTDLVTSAAMRLVA